MAGIYNREALFQKNIIDDRAEFDMGSIDFPELLNDQDYRWTVVRTPEQVRPDLISQRLYGTPDLWWFIMWLNGISDPWHDLLPHVALKYIDISNIENAVKYVRIRKKG